MMAAVLQTKNFSRASELRQRAEGLAALHAIALDLTPRQDLASLLLTLTERAVRLLDGSSGAIYLCYPDRDEVRCAASFNTPQNYTGIMLKYGEGAAGAVASATPVATARGPIQMTISLGLTAFSADIPDLAVLLDHADTAMYSAKQAGRDRVVVG